MTQVSDPKLTVITTAISDLKGRDVITLDVRTQSTEMDFIVIATGTSIQHIGRIAKHVNEQIKLQKLSVHPIEGEGTEWLLVDADEAVVHIMSQSAREFYQLEKLWNMHTSLNAC